MEVGASNYININPLETIFQSTLPTIVSGLHANVMIMWKQKSMVKSNMVEIETFEDQDYNLKFPGPKCEISSAILLRPPAKS
jgi:hypothetical protein